MAVATIGVMAGEDEALDDIVNTGVMCLDLETTGLDPHTCRIGLYIIHSNNHSYLFRSAPSWLPLILADPDTQIVGFNLKFDFMFLIKELGIEIVRNVKDLYISELLVSSERRGVSHNLQATLARRLGVNVAKDVDHNLVDWTGPLTPEMEDYAKDDVQYLLPLRDALDELVRDTRQQAAERIEQDAVFATACMTLNGIGIDRAEWEKAIQYWEEKGDSYSDELDNIDPGVTNWNSPVQLKAAAQRIHGITIPNTQFETLNILADDFELFKIVVEQRHWRKRESSWGHKYLNSNVHPVTGRIYASWWQLNTATGRFACSSPNLQQIPRKETTRPGPNMRSLFRAKSGNVLSSHDYEQIEMLTAAVMAPDAILYDLFQRGIDTHIYVGTLVTGKSEDSVTSDDRQIAKSANFGLLYGAGASTLQRYARKTYGVKLAEKECKRIIKIYFSRFKGLAAMRAYAFALFSNNPRIIEVRNIVGMRRILAGSTLKPTTWLNTRIQSTAGYGIKRAMHRLTEAGLAKFLCLQVHDELVFEHPIEGHEEREAQINECMKLGMQDVLGKSAPVGVDSHSGETWAE